ncbi:MAG: 16S rRNA (uracil(1498)-N(3))-methyltransferase [Actinomycetota bacterium]|nr:16S rRNA (uracil(1498)-N(3))-methyltransferase [Actinomycetota bacterium]
MSPPVFLLDPDRAAEVRVGGEFVLDGPEGWHAVAVQRVRAGEMIQCVDGCGRRITGSVTTVHPSDSATITVTAVTDEPEPMPQITAVQAIAKGDRGERAVQMLTEAGIDAIVPWQAEKSVARWDETKATKNRGKWATTAREATKQARRSRVPRVDPVTTSGGVAELIAASAVALVLGEQASVQLTSIAAEAARDIMLVIGPEGGLSDNERGQFTDAGAHLVQLGPSVLRTSTAGIAALSVLSAQIGRW